MARSRSDNIQAWSSRLERYRRSDTTLASFCQNENISPHNFYYWRKRLATLSATTAAHHTRKGPASSSGTKLIKGKSKRDKAEGSLDSGLTTTAAQPLRAAVQFTIHTSRAKIDCQCSSLQAIDLLLSWAANHPQSGFQQLNIGR